MSTVSRAGMIIRKRTLQQDGAGDSIIWHG